MLVLGIDPGTRHTGWCLRDDRRVWARGVIEWTGPPITSGTIHEVLFSLRHHINQWAQPDVVVVEGVEWQGRPRKRLLALGQIAGAIVGFFAGTGLPVYLLSPRMKGKQRKRRGWSEHEMDAESLARAGLRAERAHARFTRGESRLSAPGLSSIVARRVPGLG